MKRCALPCWHVQLRHICVMSQNGAVPLRFEFCSRRKFIQSPYYRSAWLILKQWMRDSWSGIHPWLRTCSTKCLESLSQYLIGFGTWLLPFRSLQWINQARLKGWNLALDHLRLLLNSVRKPFSATEGIEMARHRSATNGARLKTRVNKNGWAVHHFSQANRVLILYGVTVPSMLPHAHFWHWFIPWHAFCFLDSCLLLLST